MGLLGYFVNMQPCSKFRFDPKLSKPRSTNTDHTVELCLSRYKLPHASGVSNARSEIQSMIAAVKFSDADNVCVQQAVESSQ